MNKHLNAMGMELLGSPETWRVKFPSCVSHVEAQCRVEDTRLQLHRQALIEAVLSFNDLITLYEFHRNTNCHVLNLSKLIESSY